MKEKIQTWYNQGLWSAEMVLKAVERGVISKQDYTDIIGMKTGGDAV